MPHVSARAFTLAFAFLLAAVAAVHFAPPASSQTGPGWTTLLDGTSIGDWDRVGETNWRLEDGAVAADQKTSKDPAHLVSRARTRTSSSMSSSASPDANSGIFIRCSDPKAPSDRTCYEVNIFDQRPDPTYGTGAIVNFVEVEPMPKAGGKWNTLRSPPRDGIWSWC